MAAVPVFLLVKSLENKWAPLIIPRMRHIHFAKIKHTLPTLVLAVFLLYAQSSTLEHGVDHLSHDDQEVCQTFIGFEKSSSIPIATIELPSIQLDVQPISSASENVSLSTLTAYFARAPPISI